MEQAKWSLVQKLKANLDPIALLAFISSSSIKQQSENQCEGKQWHTARRWLWQQTSNRHGELSAGDSGRRDCGSHEETSLGLEWEGSKRQKARDNFCVPLKYVKRTRERRLQGLCCSSEFKAKIFMNTSTGFRKDKGRCEMWYFNIPCSKKW